MLYNITILVPALVLGEETSEKRVWKCSLSPHDFPATLMSDAELLHDTGILGRKKAINLFPGKM